MIPGEEYARRDLERLVPLQYPADLIPVGHPQGTLCECACGTRAYQEMMDDLDSAIASTDGAVCEDLLASKAAWIGMMRVYMLTHTGDHDRAVRLFGAVLEASWLARAEEEMESIALLHRAAIKMFQEIP